MRLSARAVAVAAICGVLTACIADPGRVQMASVRNRTSGEVRLVTEDARSTGQSEHGRLAAGEEKALGVMFVAPGGQPARGALRAYDAAGQLVFCTRYERTHEQALQPMAVEVVAGRTDC